MKRNLILIVLLLSLIGIGVGASQWSKKQAQEKREKYQFTSVTVVNLDGKKERLTNVLILDGRQKENPTVIKSLGFASEESGFTIPVGRIRAMEYPRDSKAAVVAGKRLVLVTFEDGTKKSSHIQDYYELTGVRIASPQSESAGESVRKKLSDFASIQFK